MTNERRDCLVSYLGRVEYERALEWQRRACSLVKQGHEEDLFLLLEHPPTITLGRSGQWQNLLVSDELLAERGVRRYETDRGGDITFHGPGQLVGYPIFRLEGTERDVRRYMRRMEEALIRVLGSHGIRGYAREGKTGVWTDAGKIAAMGVHISRWVTSHGFALNVHTDLRFFDLIVPCGLQGESVTSMETLLGRRPELEEVAAETVSGFEAVFGRRMTTVAPLEMKERISGGADESAVA